ncbi:MAG: putative lipid II flippase FtsW [Candidatus Zixiibacteriota bacterium]
MIDKSKPDYLLLLIVLVLISIGTVMVYSGSAILADKKFGTSTFFIKKQILWSIISLFLIFALTKIDYHRYEKFANLLLLFSLILLVVVLFSQPIKEATRWIRLGPIVFQPSEFFKYALVLFMAHSLSKRKNKIKDLKYVLLPYFLILGIASFLIMKQPHLGALLSLSIIFLVMLFVAGAKLKHILVISAPLVVAIFILVFGFGYKKQRVNDYLKSIQHPLEGSYQMRQSVLGLGAGGILGAGLGEGKQKLFFLPEPHTDFIFATLGEEGGFLICASIMILFFILALRGLSIANRATDDFGFFLALGISFCIFVCVLINAGVVVGILPTTGIPMPFLSYGGSSLIFSSMGIGVLLNISRQTRYVPSPRILSKMGG